MTLLQESFFSTPEIFTDEEFFTRLELFKIEKKAEEQKQFSADLFSDLPLFCGGEYLQTALF